MTANIQENKEQLRNFLIGKGFTTEDIEGGFEKVLWCKDNERINGNKKMGPRLINEAAKELSVYSYILKEAIDKILNECNYDKIGKVAKKNVETYKKVCKVYNDKLKKLLTK
jgi:SOS response regulatory protein OraA/RecX